MSFRLAPDFVETNLYSFEPSEQARIHLTIDFCDVEQPIDFSERDNHLGPPGLHIAAAIPMGGKLVMHTSFTACIQDSED